MMETPNPATTNTPAPNPAPTPAPAPAVATPTPEPMPQASPVVMENGGTTSDSKSFLQSLNWVEVGFSILGVAALTYVIFYYRFKLKQDKMINNELQRQIDELKMNVQSSMKGKYKTI